MTASSDSLERPGFIDAISRAYSDRGKSVIVLTGNTHDLYFSREQNRFLELEQALFQALQGNFSVLRLDAATGIDALDKTHLTALQTVCTQADQASLDEDDKLGDIKKQIATTTFSPLPALVLLRKIFEARERAKRGGKATNAKPVCTIVQFAGSLFPSGDFDRLGELDRQRLVTFLNLIESPSFKSSNNLLILVADTKTEINSRITALPSVQSIEIQLPTRAEREKYVTTTPKIEKIDFERGQTDFIDDTAGLTLTAVQDLLEVARRTTTQITRRAVLDEINTVMQADLGDIIKLSRPEHGPEDVDGYKETGEIFLDIFRRCENPDTAVPAILVSGPNGAGKTYQLEAYASRSGRVVIELAGLRGMYFGQTDTFFEKLRLRIKTYGKILILVDEAHTAFGSVHSNNTHETEKRLAGNIIKMMGDRTMFGKVVWALMTSRPDELDPDVKSRAPIQVPIFDLEGEERKTFVTNLFGRKKIVIPESDIAQVLERTASYSARDFSFLVKEVKGSGRTSVLETLDVWQASASIITQRRLQTLIAAQHCSYPKLLPADLKERVGSAELEAEITALKHALHL